MFEFMQLEEGTGAKLYKANEVLSACQTKRSPWEGDILFKQIMMFATALAILSLLKTATDHSFGAALELVLKQYENIKVLVLSALHIDTLVVQVARIFSELFDLSFVVHPHWSDVFVLLTLYLMARMTAYWSAGMRGRAVFRFIWLLVVGILTSVAAGVAEPQNLAGNISIILAVVAGLAVFDVFDAVWSATFYRMAGLTWLQDWRRYAEYSMPTIAIGIALTALLYSSYSIWSAEWIKVPGLLALIGYSVLLALYWIFRGLQSSKSSERPGTGYEKFRASSNTTIGVSMLQSLSYACICWAVDAGLSLLSGGTLAV